MLESEKTLFHVLAMKNEYMPHVKLRSEQFTPEARGIWEYIRRQIDKGGFSAAALADQEIDPQFIAELLAGPAHCPPLTLGTVSSCVDEIRRSWASKQMGKVISDAYAKSDVDAALQHLAEKIPEISQNLTGSIKEGLGDVIQQAYAALADREGEVNVVSSGLDILDAKLDGGFRPGEYVLVAARPSMGKSTFLRQIAHRCGKRVLYVSAEDTKETFALRALASMADVPLSALRRSRLDDHEWMRVGRAVKALQGQTIDLVADADVTIHDIESLAMAEKYDAIFVDYLQMIVPRNEDRYSATGYTSGALKRLAKRANCPVIVASQLNRGLEQRQEKRPIPSDLRDSGELEQDADCILFLYRDEVYVPESKDAGFVEINVAKQRNGPAGMFVYVKVAHELDKGRIG